MNTAEMRPAGLWSVEEIEAGVEGMLFRQLLRERMRQTPNEVDRELEERALDAFEEWADGYGLPTTPHVLAAYLVELHSEAEQADILEFVAAAYLNQNERDVHVPIRAALHYVRSRGACSRPSTGWLHKLRRTAGDRQASGAFPVLPSGESPPKKTAGDTPRRLPRYVWNNL